jgi:O-antigen/teichoic acid export membrane protein
VVSDASPKRSGGPRFGEAERTGLRRAAVRGGALLLGARLLTQLFLWGVTLTVAGLLRPFDYGLMTWGTLFVGLADLLAEAGVGKALVQRQELGPDDLAEGFTACLLLSVAFFGLLQLLAGPAADSLATPEFAPLLRVLALLVLLLPFRSLPLAVLERELRLGRQSGVHVASALAQAGLVLALALLGYGYWALAFGALAGRGLETAVLAYLSGWRPRLRRPGRRARGLFAFGLHVSLGSLLWFVYSNCDFAVVGKVVGAAALGSYALAFQLISLPVQKLTANVNQVVYQVFCRLQHDRARVRDWYVRLTVLLGFLGVPTLAGMALVADDAFAVALGERWREAVLPFQLLSLVGILMVFSYSLPPLFNALGRPDVNFKYTLLCTLLFPPAFTLGGLAHGVIGTCVVWLTLYPALVAGLVWSTRQLTGLRPLGLLGAQVPVLAAALFMTAAVLGVRWSLQGLLPAGARLGVCVGAGVLVYGGAVWVVARRTVLADLRALWRELRGGGALA